MISGSAAVCPWVVIGSAAIANATIETNNK
jgi:hypothetical protein